MDVSSRKSTANTTVADFAGCCPAANDDPNNPSNKTSAPNRPTRRVFFTSNSLRKTARHQRSATSAHHLIQRAAQKLEVELAAREQHVVQRLADVVRLNRLRAIASDAGLRDAPHQFLDEG